MPQPIAGDPGDDAEGGALLAILIGPAARQGRRVTAGAGLAQRGGDVLHRKATFKMAVQLFVSGPILVGDPRVTLEFSNSKKKLNTFSDTLTKKSSNSWGKQWNVGPLSPEKYTMWAIVGLGGASSGTKQISFTISK